MTEQDKGRVALVARIRQLVHPGAQMQEHIEAVSIAQTLLHETLGDRHPLTRSLGSIMEKYNWGAADGACKTFLALYDQGRLVNPRLQIARELEEDVVNVAEQQWIGADAESDPTMRQLRLAVAAFLCGAALEDALRRLCDKHGASYAPAKTNIAKLQAALYSPSTSVEIISRSENAQIGAWGQTRNNADHGHFSKITTSEVQAMIVGVRGLIEKHLP